MTIYKYTFQHRLVYLHADDAISPDNYVLSDVSLRTIATFFVNEFNPGDLYAIEPVPASDLDVGLVEFFLVPEPNGTRVSLRSVKPPRRLVN